jgi:hypothetical protein
MLRYLVMPVLVIGAVTSTLVGTISKAHASGILTCQLTSVKSGNKIGYSFLKYEADEVSTAYEWKVERNGAVVRSNTPENMPAWTMTWDSKTFWLSSTENPEYYLGVKRLVVDAKGYRFGDANVYKRKTDGSSELMSSGWCGTNEGSWKAKPNWVRVSPAMTTPAPAQSVQAEPAPLETPAAPASGDTSIPDPSAM